MLDSQFGNGGSMNQLQFIMVCGVILAASISWHLAGEAKIKEATASLKPNPSSETLNSPEQSLDSVHDSIETQAPNDNEKQALLANPKVKAYLAKEDRKQELKDYFDNPAGHDPEAIYQLIEHIENEGRMVAFEALSLKLAWLEKNTNDPEEFKTKSERIINEYKQKSQTMNAQYKPENTPGFTEYKQQEKAIIAEVNGMTDFPDGHNKQSYLRARLLQARILAYGE